MRTMMIYLQYYYRTKPFNMAKTEYFPSFRKHI